MTYRFRPSHALVLISLGAIGAGSGCGSSDSGTSLTCGSGTVQDGEECVAAAAGKAGHAGSSAGASGKGGSGGAGVAGGGAGGTGGVSAAGHAGTGGTAGGAGTTGTGGGGAGGAGGVSTAGSAGTAGTSATAGSSGAAGTGGQAATAPTFAGVTAVAPVSATSVLVTWAPGSSTLTATEDLVYRIYLSTTAKGETFSMPTKMSPPGATSFEIDALPTGSTQFAVVRAVDSKGNEDTNTVEKSTTAAADTAKPQFGGATSATAASDSSITLAWTAATDDLTPPEAITYYAYWALFTGQEAFGVPAAVSLPGATSMTVTGLPNAAAPYYLVVRARDAAGNVDINKKEVTTSTLADTTAPVFGGCTSVTGIDAGTLGVTWNAATDDATPQSAIVYNVFVATQSGKEDFTMAAEATVTGDTSLAVENLAPGTTYYVICRATDGSMNTDPNTAERSAMTAADSVAPTFKGVVSVGNPGARSLDLTWAPAHDDQTPDDAIAYDIFTATKAAGEDFTATPFQVATGLVADQTTGMMTYTVTGLKGGVDTFFVVRARDKGGNEEKNKAEQSGVPDVDYNLDIQAIFTANCAKSGCHIPGGAAPFTLTKGTSWGNLVGIQATEQYTPSGGVAGPINRVEATQPDESYMWLKLNADPGITGSSMPPVVAGGMLPDASLQQIKTWILNGAKPPSP